MVKFKETKTQIKTIRKGDRHFMISDGLVICPRAGFEVSTKCPREYKAIIQECMTNGWLNPVAHVTSREFLFAGLNDE